MGSSFRHVGVVVQNLDESLNFWKEVFGLTIAADNIEVSPYIDELLGLENPELRTVKLEDHKGFILELLKFSTYPDDIRSNQSLTSTGLTHIAINVEDVRSIFAVLKQKGYQELSEILDSPDKKVKVVFFKGPENLLLELVESNK
jgi:catechol 2,3-dioxygenase-like lactoylglutathione lyase family enzyme